MAQIKLTISADNKATQSVELLNKQIETLAKQLSSITVNNDLTAQINSLSKYYASLSNAYAKTTVNANKQAIADEKLALAKQKTATQAAKTSTELAKEKLTLEKVNTEKTRQSLNESKVQKATQVTTSQVQKLEKGYAELLNTINSIEKSYKKGTFTDVKSQIQDWLKTVQGLDSELKSGKITQETYNNKVLQATANLQGFKTEIASTKAESKNLHGTLQDVVGGFLQFQLSAMLVMKPLQMIRSALSSINETLVKTEDVVIAFQRVVGKNISGETISSELYGLAQKYGQTFDNVQSIALDFARTGLSWNDTIKATEAALLGLNTAELSADDAAQGLIAVLQQFKLDASELESVIDKLNITQDNAAVTTDKLLTALQRTGSSAKNANLTLEETVALITALSSATGRSGENLGTAINSLIQYSSKSSALQVFADLSDEAAKVVESYQKKLTKANGETYTILDVWKQVSKEIQNLTTEQANKLDEYFATEDGTALKEALDGELEDFYTEMNGVYDTANTFRKNYFIALLGNMNEVEEALGRMNEAEGYSQNQNIDYLSTYTAMQNTIKAQWEELASGESGWAEFKKDLIASGIVVLDFIKNLGGLTNATLLVGGAIGTATSLFKLFNGSVSILTKPILSLVKGFSNLIARFKTAKTAGTNFASVFKSIKTSLSDVNNYLKANATAHQKQIEYQAALRKSLTLSNSATATETEKLEAATAAETAKKAADEAATASTEALTTATTTFGAVLNAVTFIISTAVILYSIISTAVNNSKQKEEEHTKALQDSAKALTEEANALNDDNEALSENIRLLDIYIKKIKDATTSNEDRAEALSEIQSIYADLLSNYGIENDKIMLLTSSYEGLNGVLDEYLEKAKEVAAQQAKTSLDQGKKALNDAKTAQAQVSTSISLAGHEHTRRGFIEAGLGDLLSDYTRSKGVSIYGTVALDFDATEESLRVLEEAKEKLYERYSTTSGTNQMQAQAALAEVTDAIATITEALNITAEAQEAYDKAWTQNELLNTELAEYFYAAQGSTQENYDALVKLLDIINSNVEYTDKERKALKALIQKELKDYLGKYDVILNSTDEWHNDITKVTSKYEDLIATLEELRDLQQESYDWEEKKLAILEAEKALEDARNQATVRRYNSATGQWEWQTDEKAIKEAEDNLEKARLDLEQETYDKIIELLDDGVATNEGIEAVLKEVAPYLGEQFAQAFRDTILDQTGVNVAENPNEITNTTTNTDFLDSLLTEVKEVKSDFEKAVEGIKVLDGASGNGIAAGRVGDNGEVKWNGKTYKIENAGAISNDDVIAQAAIGENGLGLADRTIFAYNGEIYGYLDGRIVKLQRRANSYGDSSSKGYKALSDAVTEAYGSYDSGGIANGLGYMPKATTQPETVNGPDLTAQILSPQSNREWETYARTMGIMFEQAHNFASNPIIERVGSSTDNSVNNSGQVNIASVNFPSEAQHAPLSTLLAQFKTLPN